MLISTKKIPKHNQPIARVIKSYTNKKSKKVQLARAEIMKRFNGLDWKHQKVIIEAFLNSGKGDRDWIYQQLLYPCWDKRFESKILELWEVYHEFKCARLIINYCSQDYVYEHWEELINCDYKSNYLYYGVCERLYGYKNFVIDRRRMSNFGYLKFLEKTGQQISKAKCIDLLFNIMKENLEYTLKKREGMKIGFYDNDAYMRIPRIDYAINHGLVVVAQSFFEYNKTVEEFNKWQGNVMKQIIKTTAYQRYCTEYSQEDSKSVSTLMLYFATFYYQNLPEKYRK